jgi:chromosomal replication initiator protein
MLWFTSGFNRLAVNTLRDYDMSQAPVLTMIYGPSGIGKTELLRSCYLRLKKHPRVVYIDAQVFSSSFAYAAQEGGLTDFRNRIRSVSLLIFDHLEKLKGKKHSIEEFLHTYEALSEGGGKMIVGFQGQISGLDFLGEKLSSRMLGGLAISIGSPSASEMLEYVGRYARSRYLIVEPEVLERISTLVNNFHEAQDLIQGYVQYANVMNGALDYKAFSQYLILREQVSQQLPTPENIVRQVSEITGVEQKEIKGSQRVTRIREARLLAIFTIRTLCKLSYPEIGAYFNKAHSAIIKSCQQFQEKMESDPQWKEKFNLLLKYFHSN